MEMLIMDQSVRVITSGELLGESLTLKNKGYRLVAISCTNKDGMELTYSFNKDYELVNLRVITDTTEEISSISFIYSYAFLYENEIKELFGVNIVNMAMDFKEKFYRISATTPFKTEKEEN